jgi:hypothetical protein
MMIEPLLRWIARLMSGVRVNRVQQMDDGVVSVIAKRRHYYGSVVILLGNGFLTLAQSGVRMFVRTRDWARWEQHCVRLLYPGFSQVLAEGSGSVRLPVMPGTSLRRMLEQGEARGDAFVAAARELRRAHQLQCGFFGAGWSHGDLHLDNVLYDLQTDRAFLIDFDTRHQRGIDEHRRQADDLKVFLLELIATPGNHWRPLASAFLCEYGEANVLRELGGQLAVPRGFAKILWYTRTGGLNHREIAPRLRILEEMVNQAVGA